MMRNNWPKGRNSANRVTRETTIRQNDQMHPVLELLHPAVPNAVLSFSTDHDLFNCSLANRFIAREFAEAYNELSSPCV